MISPSQAAPRAHRCAAHGELRRRRNGGVAEASARKRCRSPGWNRKTIVLRRHQAHVATCRFGAVAGVRNSMCRQTLGKPWRLGQTANVSSLYLALLIGHPGLRVLATNSSIVQRRLGSGTVGSTLIRRRNPSGGNSARGFRHGKPPYLGLIRMTSTTSNGKSASHSLCAR